MQEVGLGDKADRYAAASSRRRAAIAELMAVQGRPGVWTDLVIVTACGESCAGDPKPVGPTCWIMLRSLCNLLPVAGGINGFLHDQTAMPPTASSMQVTWMCMRSDNGSAQDRMLQTTCQFGQGLQSILTMHWPAYSQCMPQVLLSFLQARFSMTSSGVAFKNLASTSCSIHKYNCLKWCGVSFTMTELSLSMQAWCMMVESLPQM